MNVTFPTEYVPELAGKDAVFRIKVHQITRRSLPEWNDEAIEGVVHKLAEEYEGKMGIIAQPLRIACTGGTVSPGIGETLCLIGREKTLSRLARALTEISAS